MNLPSDFLNKMRHLLKDEYEDFYKGYQEPKKQHVLLWRDEWD